jgi:hypothetical protein
MAIHLLVSQLRFARSEFMRGLNGVSADEALRRFEAMNCISWTVGHLAAQENRLWVLMAQGKVLFPELTNLVGYGKPASTPPLADMWEAWRTITAAADPYLDSLTPAMLQTHLTWEGKQRAESVGTTLLRNTYHYWFHLGEAYAVRQMLGHKGLPDFVGNMAAAAYHPEA